MTYAWDVLNRATLHIRQDMCAVRCCLPSPEGRVITVHSDFSDACSLIFDCMNEITAEKEMNQPTGRGSEGWRERNGD